MNSEGRSMECSGNNSWCPRNYNWTNLWTGPEGNGACVNRICGDHELEAGEQCDGNPVDGGKLGGVDDCTDLGFVGGGAISACDSLCNFNTAACTDEDGLAGPLDPADCGNGVIDPGEDCDWNATLENLTIFRNDLRCSSFNSWKRGALACHPKGSAQECRADTAACGVCTGGCGNVEMNCSLPVVIDQGTPDETDDIVVKVDGSLPGDPTYATAANWTACQTPDMDGNPANGVLPPSQTCNTLYDCVYATEAGQPNPGTNPTCYDFTKQDRVMNARGEAIKCQRNGFWCPEGFVYDDTILDGESRPRLRCVEENKVCDWGRPPTTTHGCNTIQGILEHRLWCLNDFNGIPDAPDGPPYQRVCAPVKFSLGGGFRLYFTTTVKVY